VSIEDNRADVAHTSSEKELRLVTETIPALVWRAGPDGYVDYVNKRVLEYFGASIDKILGWGWMEQVHPDDVAFKVTTWLENLESGNSHDAVCRMRGADGRYRWFEVRGEPLRASDGTTLSWYGVMIDIDDRRRAEEALRESEFGLRQIMEAVPAFVWSTDPDGEPTHMNQRLLDYSGMRFEEFKRLGWEALVHPDDFPETARAFYQAIHAGTPHQWVTRLRRADGEFRCHQFRIEPLRDQQGRIIQWYGVTVDVDDGKEAEEQPRFEAQLRAILNVLPALTWYAPPSGGLTFVNKRQGDFLGLPKDHPLRFGIDIGVPWDAHIPFLHPDDQEKGRKYWANSLRTGEGYEHSYRVRDAEGNYRWLLTRTEPLRASDGTLQLWIGATLDIEGLKRAEQALRRSEAYLTEAQRLSRTGSFGWTPSTGKLHWSDETLRILEYDQSIEPTIERVLQRIHPDDRAMVHRLIYETSSGETNLDVTHRLLMPDGSVKFVHVLSHALKDADGDLEVVGALMDVTENTLLYRDLAQREARLMEQTSALSRSEAHLAEAQQLSHTGSSVFNDTAILYWSDETYRIYELDPLEGLPSREATLQRIHPDDQERVVEVARQAVHQKREYNLEYRILLPTGTIKYIEGIAHPKFSGSGEFAEVFSTLVDVTERKRAEQALRESEAKFRDYAETASDWFWEIGPDYKFMLLTGNAFGSNPAGRIGTSYWDHALDLETEPEKWRIFRETLDARRPLRDFVYRSVRADGTPIDVKASGKPVLDADGEFHGYRGTGTDVTAIMRTQAALRESEQSARSALDGIAGLITVNDHNGKLETVNRQVLEYFGQSLEWLKNWGTNDAVHPEDLPRIFEIYQRATTSGIPFNYEVRLRRFDGEYRWFDNRAVPIRDDSGRVVRWYVLLTDIEDRTRALTRLEQMQSDFAHINRVSMMGELAASLSHEIAQPIAAAHNNARAAIHFLDRTPPDLDQVSEALAGIVDNSDRAAHILERIRDQTRKAPPRKETVNLNEAIEEVIVLARSEATKARVSIQTHLADGLSPVQADRVQLQQVVLNLILNAVEALNSIDAGPRKLSISTEQKPTQDVAVTVRDTGPGIDREHMDRIFQAFYTTKSSGVGMGLAISRSIIEAHAGRLWAEANKPRGAAFRFTLPTGK
jgi:PAS domain S-box-containing protein